jgi:hypothetical protein
MISFRERETSRLSPVSLDHAPPLNPSLVEVAGCRTLRFFRVRILIFSWFEFCSSISLVPFLGSSASHQLQ